MNRLDKGFHDVTMAEYLRDPAIEPSLSSGGIWTLLNQSPAHAWADHPRLNPNRAPYNNSVMDAGTVAHYHLLGADERELVVVDADDWRAKDAKAARQHAWDEGRIPILAKLNERAKEMAEAAREYLAHTEFAKLLDDGDSEQTMIWRVRKTYCRGRLDHMGFGAKVLFDYKSTAGSASPAVWSRQMINMGYDIQAEHYIRGARALLGPDPDRVFVFLVQENFPPYACSLIGAGGEMLELASGKIDHALALWSSCMATKTWPAYPTQIAWAMPPAWAMSQWEDQKALTHEFDPELATQA